MRNINEPDWKIFREVHKTALERFCERIMDEIEDAINDRGRSAHERYLAVYRLIHKRDKEVARLFNDFRRSTALLQLASLKGSGVLTAEEFDRFSEETKTLVAVLLGEMPM